MERCISMEFTDLLAHRACVRSYKEAPVTPEQIKAILAAGIRAPNACNYQSWHFYAVTDREKIRSAHRNVAYIPWANEVPLIIVVCVREEIVARLCERFGAERGRAFAEHDAAGAINHMLLRAADLGLGGCWIGPMDIEKCKKHFDIADGHTPTAILTIGTPASEPSLRDRRPLSEAVTFVGESVDLG
jgi:nitroreductase